MTHSSRPGITDATVTVAPARTSVSVMHAVSISSLSSAIGTSTLRGAAAAAIARALPARAIAVDARSIGDARSVQQSAVSSIFYFFVVSEAVDGADDEG